MSPSIEEELATASRLLAAEGLFYPYGHVSARETGTDRFYLNRDTSPALVTTDDLQTFDMEGRLVEGTDAATYEEVEIHRAIYAARPGVGAVVHHHAEEIMPYTIPGVTLGSSAEDSVFPTFEDYGPTKGRLVVERMEEFEAETDEMFEYAYAEPPEELERQREYLRELREKYGDEELLAAG